MADHPCAMYSVYTVKYSDRTEFNSTYCCPKPTATPIVRFKFSWKPIRRVILVSAAATSLLRHVGSKRWWGCAVTLGSPELRSDKHTIQGIIIRYLYHMLDLKVKIVNKQHYLINFLQQLHYYYQNWGVEVLIGQSYILSGGFFKFTIC